MRNHLQNTASFHHSFGSSMMGYKNEEFNYSFDFNGKETDSETGLQDYGERIYNKAIAKFLSPDPLIVKGQQYPELSPYQFASNTPIQAIDLDGLEAFTVIKPIIPGLLYGPPRTINRHSTSKERRDATITVIIAYPLQSYMVGEVIFGGKNLSSVSGRIARHASEKGNLTENDGGERNAFRHALWSATMTTKFGEEVAKRIGNAHEGVLNGDEIVIDFTKPFRQDLKLGDQIVDALNNEIGRNIAKCFNKDATQNDIAQEVLRVFYVEGLWVVKTDEKGNMFIVREKITEEQYLQGLENIKNLDNHGFSEVDKKKLEEEDKKSVKEKGKEDESKK